MSIRASRPDRMPDLLSPAVKPPCPNKAAREPDASAARRRRGSPLDAGEAASLDSWWAGGAPTPGGARRGGAPARALVAAALAVALAACGAAATSADVPARGPLRGAWPADWDEQRNRAVSSAALPAQRPLAAQRGARCAATGRRARRDRCDPRPERGGVRGRGRLASALTGQHGELLPKGQVLEHQVVL